jgi:hypothetical protein
MPKFIQKYLKLFFFTTSKHSTGLLINCKKIITFYNGEIWLESRGYRDYIFCKIKKNYENHSKQAISQAVGGMYKKITIAKPTCSDFWESFLLENMKFCRIYVVSV